MIRRLLRPIKDNRENLTLVVLVLHRFALSASYFTHSPLSLLLSITSLTFLSFPLLHRFAASPFPSSCCAIHNNTALHCTVHCIIEYYNKNNAVSRQQYNRKTYESTAACRQHLYTMRSLHSGPLACLYLLDFIRLPLQGNTYINENAHK